MGTEVLQLGWIDCRPLKSNDEIDDLLSFDLVVVPFLVVMNL